MRMAARSAMTALLFAVAGCGTSPPVTFFTLAAEPRTAGAPTAVSAFSVVVGPVTVPELVDRPQLVLRTSSTQVQVLEQARWAASLKSEIPRVIAADLSRLLPEAKTATSSQRAVTPPEYRVLVDVQRFDSAPDSATIEAAWTVRSPDGTVVAGRSMASERTGPGYDSLVAAHGRALTAVSADIAAAIAKLRIGG